MNKLRIYIDTSVVGGCFDKAYSEASRGIFRMAKQGAALLIISPVLQDELINAPVEVKDVLMGMPLASMEPVLLTDEVVELSQAYLEDDVVVLWSWRICSAGRRGTAEDRSSRSLGVGSPFLSPEDISLP